MAVYEVPGAVGSDLETASLASGYSTTTASLMEPPSHIPSQYAPLLDVFHSHNEPIPQPPGIRESNSEAMIRALKALQEKIRSLELERASATSRFQHLTSQMRHQQTNTEETNALRQKVDSADARFALQKQEVGLLRERLQRAEEERKRAVERSQRLEKKQRDLLASQQQRLEEQQQRLRRERQQSPEKSPQSSEKALLRLEREQAMLKAQQAATAVKLRDVEGKMLQEQWQRRRRMREGASSPELLDADNNRKGSSVSRKPKTPSGRHYKPVPGIHYHLNMKDVPFTVGTSTSPSHSLPTNYQSVLALMKYHNPVLCGAAAANIKRRRRIATATRKKPQQQKQVQPPMSVEELQGLLTALEEEFGRLTFEHQELALLIQEQATSTTPVATGDLEKELQHLVERLESKMEQIEVVRHLMASCSKQRKTKKGGGTVPRAHTAVHVPENGDVPRAHTAVHVPENGEVEIVTTVRPKQWTRPPQPTHKDEEVPSSDSSGGSRSSTQESLQMLRKMKQLQHTLQSDDLSWK